MVNILLTKLPLFSTIGFTWFEWLLKQKAYKKGVFYKKKLLRPKNTFWKNLAPINPNIPSIDQKYGAFYLNIEVRVHWLVLLVQLSWRVASPSGSNLSGKQRQAKPACIVFVMEDFKQLDNLLSKMALYLYGCFNVVIFISINPNNIVFVVLAMRCGTSSGKNSSCVLHKYTMYTAQCILHCVKCTVN